MDATDTTAADARQVALDAPLRSEATSRLIIEIAAAASGELDLDQILHEALDRLRGVIPLTGGSIALVRDDELVIRAATGPFSEEAVGQSLRRGPSRSWTVVETLEPFRTGDLLRDGTRAHGKVSSTAMRSWLAVPIVRHGIGIGLMEVDSTEVDAFSAADEELLAAVVGVLAGHVELAAHHDEQQRSNALREAFIGVISHELRTPITTIYGLARVLRRRGSELDEAVRSQSIADIEAESDRLYRLVEDLLVLSRAESGRVEFEAEPISLGRLVERITEAEAERRPDRRFQVRLPEGMALIEGEPTYVEQVIRNLLTNAVKYSSAPDPIEVEIEVRETDSAIDEPIAGDTGRREAVVRVLDRGIGIDDETSAHAFDLFFRTREATRIASGAGIGLFVSRQLIEAMGGRTWLEPRAGGGTEAGFALPLTEVEDERGSTTA
ncbi:MAG TPA: ATP-binding protein [Candidatus Limnocylindrales bacterium]|nr:ATP-binding protein [Candidatus Limnocylindrales bacterium]